MASLIGELAQLPSSVFKSENFILTLPLISVDSTNSNLEALKFSKVSRGYIIVKTQLWNMRIRTIYIRMMFLFFFLKIFITKQIVMISPINS